MDAAGLFIDGAQRAAASGATHPVDDPSTGQPWLEVALGDADDVEAAVAAAALAAMVWGRWPRARAGRRAPRRRRARP